MLSYEQFMNAHSFPIPFREFNYLSCAIQNGLILLIKDYLSYGAHDISQSLLSLDIISEKRYSRTKGQVIVEI